MLQIGAYSAGGGGGPLLQCIQGEKEESSENLVKGREIKKGEKGKRRKFSSQFNVFSFFNLGGGALTWGEALYEYIFSINVSPFPRCLVLPHPQARFPSSTPQKNSR